MPNLILVMLGGAFGSGARYLVASRLTAPWGTLTVNVLGGLLMGALAGALMRSSTGSEPTRMLLAVGVLGGFTTFSAFSLDSWFLLERGQVPLAVGYIGASVIASIGALALGITLVRAI